MELAQRGWHGPLKNLFNSRPVGIEKAPIVRLLFGGACPGPPGRAGAVAEDEDEDQQPDEDQADGQNRQDGVVQRVALAAINDSISLTVSGCGSPAACRTPGTPIPFARSSGVRSLASFACRSAPCSARNFTNGVKPRCAAPCSAV